LKRVTGHATSVPCADVSSTNRSNGSAEMKLAYTEKVGRVGIVYLNRPKALNALSNDLTKDLLEAFKMLEADRKVNVIIITSVGRAFVAGADIKEMKDLDFFSAFTKDHLHEIEVVIGQSRLPTIAAVNGYALGGGCELAMMCDIIYASEKAKFGQPEIKLGTIPGLGGTQRLTRAIGKSKAMELILGGGMMTAEQAKAAGLVSCVCKPKELVPKAMELAKKISKFSRPVLMLAKKAVLAAFNTPLDQGLAVERHIFHSTFGLHDQGEGMAAFSEKRKPKFEDK